MLITPCDKEEKHLLLMLVVTSFETGREERHVVWSTYRYKGVRGAPLKEMVLWLSLCLHTLPPSSLDAHDHEPVIQQSNTLMCLRPSASPQHLI